MSSSSSERIDDYIKYINDPVYGGIPITEMELKLIDTPLFQRLRGLKQLAHVNYVFPGAEHSRFVHSLGVLFIMGEMTNHLMRKNLMSAPDARKMRAAALLHDIGHYPLSHLGEAVYGYCLDQNLASFYLDGAKSENPLYKLASSHSKSAHHEKLGRQIVENNHIINKILLDNKLDPGEIGAIFTGEIGSSNMVFSQLLHSSLDADRLDYLLRDSYQTGVKYGLVDLQYLIRLLMVQDQELDPDGPKTEVLACNKKGQHVVEHFLMSRYFHYSQVVFHKTNVAFEGLIKAMCIKLLQAGTGYIYNSLDEIKNNINDDDFPHFNDASLYMALKEHYENSGDGEFKGLYEMYIKRIRPKVIFDIKDLYDESPSPEFSVLKWMLKREPQKISEIVGGDRWGYQIMPINVERIQGKYPLTERMESHEEDLREAVRLYDCESGGLSYLAEDQLSVISRLASYTSEFIRIYVLEEKNEVEYDRMRKKIKNLIQS